MFPHFHHPWIFFLLPALFFLWRRRKAAALRHGSLEPLQSLRSLRPNRARRWGTILRALGMASLVLALAGPRWPDPGTRIPAEGIALALVVDVSRSMDNKDFFWQGEVITRLEGVKKSFLRFVDGRANDLIALVPYATRPETACPLTLDHKTLRQILDKLEAKSIVTEATSNPGDALAWALHLLHQAPTKRKAILFLSDGESNVPPPALTPRQAGQLAANLKIPIYALDANFEDDEPGADAVKARQTMKDLADMSGGMYFMANDGTALDDAVTQIDRLEKSGIDSHQYRRYREGYVWCGLLALACWALVLGLEWTRWRRLP